MIERVPSQLKPFLFFTSLSILLGCGGCASTGDGRPDSSNTVDNRPAQDARDFVVYAFSQSGVEEEDPQVYQLNPDVNIRAIQKWSTMGDQASDYNFDPIARYHENGILFIGGGTASVIFRDDFASEAIFDDMSTQDAGGEPVPHDEIVPGFSTGTVRRGNLFNPAYRQYLLDWAKLQIDGGVDGICFDEVISGFSGGPKYDYNGNEGFDDYALVDFNRYLMQKYPDFTAAEWKSRFGMTDDNIIHRNLPADDLAGNFNYRTYLQANGWNNNSWAIGPFNSSNPLASEWGKVTGNRMHAGDTSFTATYLRRYWKQMVNELRAYAMNTAGRKLLITSNGIFPYVDFNSVGLYVYNPEGEDVLGVDYVPVVDGHLDGARSLRDNYRYLKMRSREVAGDAPVVVFLDWPNDMINRYFALPVREKMDYWRIFGAEAYANAIYPAFHLNDTVGGPTAEESGVLDFLQTYTRFYKDHRSLYQKNDYAPEIIRVSADNISASLLAQPGSQLRTLHLVNHNYRQRILPQGAFQVAVELAYIPTRIRMISPDFAGELAPRYTYQGGTLTVNVEGIEYYNVIVIE